MRIDASKGRSRIDFARDVFVCQVGGPEAPTRELVDIVVKAIDAK
jgi:hypothetical protein